MNSANNTLKLSVARFDTHSSHDTYKMDVPSLDISPPRFCDIRKHSFASNDLNCELTTLKIEEEATRF